MEHDVACACETRFLNSAHGIKRFSVHIVLKIKQNNFQSSKQELLGRLGRLCTMLDKCLQKKHKDTNPDPQHLPKILGFSNPSTRGRNRQTPRVHSPSQKFG